VSGVAPAATDPIVAAAALRAVCQALGAAAQLPQGDARISSVLGLCQRVLARLPGTPVAFSAAGKVNAAATLTAARVQSYLDRRFPGQHLRLQSYVDVPGGRSKLTSLLTLADNAILPTELVMRRDHAGSAQNTSVRDEFPVLQSLHVVGVLAPEALWLEADDEALGAPFLVMRRSPGAAPGDYWSAGSATPALCLQLATALARLHRVAAQLAWPQASSSARDCVAGMLETYEARVGLQYRPQHGALAQGYAWAHRELARIDGASVAIHGDVHFGNTLVADQHLHCLIDWEFTHAGHAAEDLAFCRGHVESVMPWRDFIARYRDAGGPAVTAAQLQYFQVWTYLRNLTLATAVMQDIRDGKVDDLQNMVIALDARPRLEAALLAALPS
jgi:aminoglycoside phosphotransferase (APT) family kinase protein